MTMHELYAAYVDAFGEWCHFEESARTTLAGPAEDPFIRRLLSVEGAVEQLGREDATGGRDLRSRSEFEGALRQGRDLPAGLREALESGA